MLFMWVATKVANNIKKMENIFMNYLNYTFNKLCEIGVCENNLTTFSKKYLKKSGSYARTYRARGKDLPLPTLIVLTASVDKTANNLLNSNVGRVAGEELKKLSAELATAVYDKALSSS